MPEPTVPIPAAHLEHGDTIRWSNAWWNVLSVDWTGPGSVTVTVTAAPEAGGPNRRLLLLWSEPCHVLAPVGT